MKLGIDIGGTTVNVGVVRDDKLLSASSYPSFEKEHTLEETLGRRNHRRITVMNKKTLISCLLVGIAVIAGAKEQTLSSWKLRKNGSNEIIDVKVPTTVAGALAQKGKLPADIYYADNYSKLDKSIYDDGWTFSANFSANTGKGIHNTLVFNSIDFYADIVLNGHKLADADTTAGVFIVREFDVTGLLNKKGDNILEVTVYRARKGDLNIGFVDWNPRPLGESMGITGDVVLKTTGRVSVKDAFVKPELDVKAFASADLSVDVMLANNTDKTVKGILTVSYENGTASVPVSVPAGGTKVRLTPEEMGMLHIEKPRVWWTWDLGTPELYHMNVSFTEGGRLSDNRNVRFGVRSITSEVKDNFRQFFLNGRRVLVKGAGWTDELLLRDTHESNLLQAEYVKDMGMNCIRFENIWGKDDNIYDCCDSLGLMAMVGWSCQWEWEDYCGLPETDGYGCISSKESIDMAVRYFHDQVIRLHNHPSIICWLTGSDRIPCPELEKRYMEIYDEYEYRPYVCSAKNLTSRYGGPSGTKMDGPYDYVGPDYWYVDEEGGGAFGFNTETGVGMNIPQLPSLKRMMPESSLWPLSHDWDVHCTSSSSAMNNTQVMTQVMNGTFGKASTLVEYVNRAHALDYDATRAMYEAFRCNIPTSTGIIQWMLNSAWPSLYWQQYDWYMVPTAAYYGTRKACTPVQLIFNYKDNCVYAVNESGADVSATARIRICDTSSNVVSDISLPVNATDNKAVKVAPIDRAQGIFLALELTDGNGEAIADNFYCLPAENNVYNWKKANWYMVPISKYSDLSFVSALPEAKVEMNVVRTADKYTVTLTNTSNTVSFQNILQLTGADGNLIVPAFWSDNFISLLPGQTRTVTCRCSATGEVKLQAWNTTIGSLSVADSSDTRDRSRYANDSFRDDDRYMVEAPYATVHVNQTKSGRIKNIIFMIGDGMGLEQLSTAWVLNGGALNIDNFIYTGFSRTHTVNKLITDSCAGGSALGTGVKTKYGWMGLDPEGNPVESSLCMARDKGMKTGVIVTCRLNDATPLDFFGHSDSRDDEEANAAQYVDSGIDFIAGGGIKFWRNRQDGRDLVAEMRAKGYEFAETNEEIEATKGDKVLALMAETEMAPALERDNYLERTTMKAIETLNNRNGFFLMVEGSCIDDWAHKQKVGYMAEELFDFDRTVGKVLQWAEKDGHTLVVVTADHNTGGLTLIKGSLEDRSVKVHFSTKGHNGIAVPVFAYGPDAGKFVGIHDNAEVGQLVKDSLDK